MNRLSMDERQTIIWLLRLGWKQRWIARETGFHRATVRRVAGQLADAVSKRTTAPEVATDSAVVAVPKCTTPPEVATDSARSRSACEPHRAFIPAEVVKGRNAVAIYQDLVEHHGYAGAYNAVKRFVGNCARRTTQKSVADSKRRPAKKRKSITVKARLRVIQKLANTAVRASS